MNEVTMTTKKTGLHLVTRAVRNENLEREVREGSTGRVVVMLPRVWAVAETAPEVEAGEVAAPETAGTARVVREAPVAAPGLELAFYRKYTEAMLRRYLRLSMSAGRVPSLLGRELFRGNVSSYRVSSFEDAVIFCFDVERCLNRLSGVEKELIRRITLQDYSRGEAASLLGISHRNCNRRYDATLDRVTGMLLEGKLLDPQNCCQ